MKKRFASQLLREMDHLVIEQNALTCASAEEVLYGLRVECPELEANYSDQEIMDIADLLIMSELHAESKRLSILYQQFNHGYFEGGLPDYAVRVVYDLWETIEEVSEPMGTVRDHGRKTLYLRYVSHDKDHLIPVLLREMAFLATVLKRQPAESWDRYRFGGCQCRHIMASESDDGHQAVA